MNNSEFWENLDFDTIKPFSICRNEKWENEQNAMLKMYEILKNEYDISPLSTQERIQIRKNRDESLIKIHSGHWQHEPPFINKEMDLLPKFCEFYGEFDKKFPQVSALNLILQTPLTQEFVSMCRPVFRDGIAFYKNQKFVDCLYICFSCMALTNEKLAKIKADHTVFGLLEQWFKGFFGIIINRDERLEIREKIREIRKI